MTPHAILGVAAYASEDEIKKAYRKLAMQHHPDRGGNTEDFQRIQAAYAELEKNNFRAAPQPSPQASRAKQQWSKPEAPGGTWRDRNETIDDIFEQMKRANRGHPGASSWSRSEDEDLVARVGIREAFSGFNMQVNSHNGSGGLTANWVNIPAGTPHGYRGTYYGTNGGAFTITTAIETGAFKLRGFENADDFFAAGFKYGDMETTFEIDAIDLITGAWVDITDFLGDSYKVRVPAGFDPKQRLKLANKGYYGWDDMQNKVVMHRQDLYIKLVPVWKSPDKIDKNKILNLYNSVEWENES